MRSIFFGHLMASTRRLIAHFRGRHLPQTDNDLDEFFRGTGPLRATRTSPELWLIDFFERYQAEEALARVNGKIVHQTECSLRAADPTSFLHIDGVPHFWTDEVAKSRLHAHFKQYGIRRHGIKFQQSSLGRAAVMSFPSQEHAISAERALQRSRLDSWILDIVFGPVMTSMVLKSLHLIHFLSVVRLLQLRKMMMSMKRKHLLIAHNHIAI